MLARRRARGVHRVHRLQPNGGGSDTGHGWCAQGPLAGGWSWEAGGARVVYYYHSDRIPLFLLTAYSKSRQPDLLPAQRAAMRLIVAEIVKQYTYARR